MCRHDEKREFVVEKLPDMRGQDRALWRRLSPRRRCSDDSVSVTLGVEFVSLVHQDDIIWATLSCSNRRTRPFLLVERSVHTPNHAPIALSQLPLEVSRVWLQKRCLFPRRRLQPAESFRPHEAVIKLKLWHNRVEFRLFSRSKFASSGFYAHMAPKLTREMRQAVLIQHDLIKSDWIFESSWKRWHRFSYIFQRLWANRHL